MQTLTHICLCFGFIERLIVVAEHYETSMSDLQKQGKPTRWDCH